MGGIPLSTPTPCGEKETYSCVEIEGEFGTLEGGDYATESECLSAVNTPCSPAAASWNCIEGDCINPGDGTGDYADITTCLLNCVPCIDPIVTILKTDATTTFTGGIWTCQNNGTIKITASTSGTTWDYIIENVVTGLGVASDVNIPSNSSANFNFLTEGTYTVTVTDILGCATTVGFTIGCNTNPPPCATEGPYYSGYDPPIANTCPHDIMITNTPATVATCDNGTLGVGIGTLGNGATSITNIQLWDMQIIGNPILLYTDNTIHSPLTSVSIPVALNSNIANATRPYKIIITDDLICQYEYEGNVRCNYVTPTYDCSTHPLTSPATGNIIPSYTCYDPVAEGFPGPGGGPHPGGVYTDITAAAAIPPFANALAECQDGCGPPCPPDAFTMNPLVIGAACSQNCMNGQITVKMDGYSSSYSPPPTTWSVSFWEETFLGSSIFVDMNLTQTGLAIPTGPGGPPVIALPVTNLSPGVYQYRIEDNNGCEYIYTFTIVCFGCTDSTATNYCGSATADDGSCMYSSVYGCTDPLASNYNAAATIDDGSCVYVATPVSWSGCMNTACYSYNSDGTGTVPANPTPNGLPCYQDPFCINSTSGAYYDATECSCSSGVGIWCCGNY